MILCFFSSLEGVAATGGELLLSNDNFISPGYSATQDKTFSNVGVRLRSDNLADSFYAEPTGLGIDLESRFTPQQSALNYLNIRQLYFRQWGLVIGRMKHNWSELDDQWQLGLTQPLFRGNIVEPDPQGLTGIFMELRGPNSGLRLFGSFIHIPNQEPTFALDNGQFAPVNPWFKQPITEFTEASGEVDPIHYKIDTSKVSSLVLNPSYMVQLFSGEQTEGLYFQAALGYKPANALSPGWVPIQGPDQVWQNTVTPLVNYQTVTTADLRYSSGSWALGAGGFRNNPDSPKDADGLNYITFSPSMGFSPFVEWSHGAWKLATSFLRIWGADSQENGPGVGKVPFPQQDDYLFTNAVRASVQFRGESAAWKRWRLQASYTTDLTSQFSLLDATLSYQVQDRWRAYGGLLLIAGGTSASTNYWQDRDVVEAGVGYVF